MDAQENLSDLAARALNPAELVDYQEGSVVSRALVSKKAGTVTFFAFDAGEGLSEHTAPFDAFVLVLEGEAEITLSGETVTATQGQMVIMPAGDPHALMATQRFKMMLVMVKE